MFPQKWDGQFQTTDSAALAVDEWAEAIQMLSDEELADGVRKVRIECKWPPSIAEFVSMCSEPDDMWQHKSAAYSDSGLKKISMEKAQDSVVKSEREKLKAMGILK